MGVVIVVEGVEGVDGEFEGEPLGPLLLVLVVFAVSGVVDTERAVCDPVLGVLHGFGCFLFFFCEASRLV